MTNRVTRERVNWSYIGRGAVRCVVIGALWFAVDAMAHCRLRPSGFAMVVASWIVWDLVANYCGSRRKGLTLVFQTCGLVCAAGTTIALNHTLDRPLSVGTIWYVAGLTWLALALLERVLPEGREGNTEGVRLALAVAAAWWAVFPLFTDRLVGGTDARWYAYMMADFIEQARSGEFPIFLGQGPHGFNGGVHPFRSAPLYMWIAGLWDYATFRSLSVVALQHLSAITAVTTTALLMYGGFKRLSPRAPWVGVIVAAVYVLSPGALAPLYCADMYMTFVAMAALPLVVIGNIRVATDPGPAAWRMLGAGLALVWMGHPPTAMHASLLTLAVQVFAWSNSDRSLADLVWSGARFGLWFGMLGAYYFLSMSELPPQPGEPAGTGILVVGAVGLVWLAAYRGGLRQQWRWLVFAPPALIFLSLKNQPWLFCSLGMLVSALAIGCFVGRKEADRGKLPSVMGVILLFCAAGAWHVSQARGIEANSASVGGLRAYAKLLPDVFSPLSRGVGLLSDFQPGYSLLLLLGAALIAPSHRALGRVLGVIGALMLVLMIRIPSASDFLVGYAPRGIAHITSLPLPHRLFPTTFACTAVAGGLALAFVAQKRPRTVAVLGILALSWSAFQASRFVDRGLSATDTRANTERKFLSENAVADRFIYDLLSIPDYYSNGKTDPALETRFLDSSLRVKIGPEQIATLMEANGEQSIHLTSEPFPNSADWLKIAPSITVNPGQYMLLRFSFRPEIRYDGYLIFRSQFDDYREYILPASGMPAAFGVSPTMSHVIPLWNSTNFPVEYKLSHYRRPESTVGQNGSDYADLKISRYDRSRSPINIISWLPYRASVNAPERGFLETPRVFLPGYRARVDGRPAEPLVSGQRLLMVAVDAGQHEVEVRYIGTPRLWFGAIVSAAAWALGLILYWKSRNIASSPAV